MVDVNKSVYDSLFFAFLFFFCRKIFIKMIQCGFNAHCTFDVMDIGQVSFSPVDSTIHSYVMCCATEN